MKVLITTFFSMGLLAQSVVVVHDADDKSAYTEEFIRESLSFLERELGDKMDFSF